MTRPTCVGVFQFAVRETLLGLQATVQQQQGIINTLVSRLDDAEARAAADRAALTKALEDKASVTDLAEARSAGAGVAALSRDLGGMADVMDEFAKYGLPEGSPAPCC